MTTDADNFWDRVGSAEGLARAPSLFMDWLMYSLDYIPNKFYFAVLANEPGAADKLSTLYKELGEHGVILLDADGVPTCLSGKKPVLKRGARA